ncbi:hypothetical protein J2749_002338 [Methanobacterium oryzae]
MYPIYFKARSSISFSSVSSILPCFLNLQATTAADNDSTALLRPNPIREMLPAINPAKIDNIPSAIL